MKRPYFADILKQGIYYPESSKAILEYKVIENNSDGQYLLFATDFVTEYLFFGKPLADLKEETIAAILEELASDLPIQ